MSIEPVPGSPAHSPPPVRLAGAAAPKPAGRELWSVHVPEELGQVRLSWSERLWVYNVLALLPLYAAVAATAALLAGASGWRDVSVSAWPAVTILVGFIAAMHLWSWFLEMTIGGGRRAKAVLSRPLRAGRHVWAIACGDRVHVYRLERAPSHVPHLWPFSLGIRARIAGGREFSADDEAEEAYAYAADVEKSSRPHLPATAIADVINQRERSPIACP